MKKVSLDREKTPGIQSPAQTRSCKTNNHDILHHKGGYLIPIMVSICKLNSDWLNPVLIFFKAKVSRPILDHQVQSFEPCWGTYPLALYVSNWINWQPKYFGFAGHRF